MHLTSECLCLRGIEVEGNRRGGEGLVLAIVVQLTRLGIVDSYQAFDKIIVAVCHRAIVWSGIIIIDGKEEAERVVIDLASLLVAELLTYETFVALLLKLSQCLPESGGTLRECMPNFLAIVANSTRQLFPAHLLTTSHHSLQEAYVRLQAPYAL